MSHFTVAIITETLDNLEKLLAPYQENNMGDCPKQYLAFHNVEDEYRRVYENESAEHIQLENGRVVSPYDEVFRKVTASGSVIGYEVPAHLKRVQVPHKQKYSSFDDFMIQYEGFSSCDEETGKWGYWENPNAKWDWWATGGRWSDSLLLKSGKRADAAQIKDIFFIEEANHEGVTIEIEGYQVPASLAPTFQITVAEASQAWDEVIAGKGFYKPEYYLKRYGDKQSYIREMLCFSTYAVITPDGVWHAKGDMGWFGISSESPEKAKEFSMSYFDTFIRNANPEHYLVLVDCHI
ncbi:hypothetical protein UY286_04985 [Paenibacillus polymyxa]|uniref:hypothetical protein n=1 Tax=Paenibacillus polymyxa TaxID=1406 RepID=UPI002AB4D423|nr:hypothetical protein [Paenibacillus polymyxa]MDY7989850.1 hypothetical protein [Paenibacillus polymyxa]MDY8116791.1 hypothetical protein [Paenibacillus polymyxa]